MRIKYNSKPELLLDKNNPDANEGLFIYINSFNKDGGLKVNLSRRLNVIEALLSPALS